MTGATTAPPASLSRRIIRWGLRGVLAVPALVSAGLLAGFAWEQIESGRFADRFPPPGRIVTLEDGRALHLMVRGEGEPTLVLVSGAGGPHSDWDGVIDRLAETTRVIAYDRPGYGWSDPSSAADAASITADLDEALELLGMSESVVLVGHSIGGVYIRHYSANHPEKVAGLVFVDSSHEDQEARMPAAVTEMMATMDRAMGLVATGSRFGLVRVADAAGLLPEGALPIPSGDAPAEAMEMRIRSSVLRSIVREYRAISTSAMQSREAHESFGDLPILVLSATLPPPVPPEAESYVPEMQATWVELQGELAALSTNSRHLGVADAGHYVQWDRPDVVVDEITSMVESIRAVAPLPPVAEVRNAAAPPPP